MTARRTVWTTGLAGAIGLGLGLLLPALSGSGATPDGHADSEQSTASAVISRPKQVPAHPPKSDEATLESMLLSLQLAAHARSLQASLDGALDELDRRRETGALVGEAIAQLDDTELRGVLATTLRLSSDELDEIQDLPAFAMRASEIAMAGLLYEDPEPTVGGEVFFTSVMPEPDSDVAVIDRFTQDDDRIFAVFETPSDHAQRITMKWSRVDDPEILLLGRKRIRPEDEYGFVYRRREQGWTPGAYRVDVFGGDEAMQLLASGRYVIE